MKEANLEGYVISICVASLGMDFKNISEGFTRDKSFKPNLKSMKYWAQTQKTKPAEKIQNPLYYKRGVNIRIQKKRDKNIHPCILLLKLPSGALSRLTQALFI